MSVVIWIRKESKGHKRFSFRKMPQRYKNMRFIAAMYACAVREATHVDW